MLITEMREGLARGRRLMQKEWADPKEIAAVDQLVAEGVAKATPWEYHGNFQCSRRIVTAALKGGNDAT